MGWGSGGIRVAAGAAGLACLCTLVVRPVQASEVSFFGVALRADPDGRGMPPAGGDPYRPGVSYGGGAFFEIPVVSWVGLETGGEYLQRRFSDTSGATLVSTVLEVPLDLRVWLGFHWSVGFGGYVSSAIGNLKTVGGDLVNYSDYGWRKLDYGGLGSLRYDFGGMSLIGLFIEARYTFGMANLSNQGPGTEVKETDIQALLGVRIGG